MGEWKSVKDALPQPNTSVLVYIPEHDGVHEGCMIKDGLWSVYSGHGVITHWMPMPEPPKDGSKD